MSFIRRFSIQLAFVLLSVLGSFFLFSSCGEKKADTKEEVNVWVDISFKPLLEQEHLIFNTGFGKKQTTTMHYVTETEAFRGLLDKKTSMIITSRPITKEEKKYFILQDSAVPQSSILAYDEVCLLLSPDINQINFTTEDIKQMLSGSSPNPPQIVVEGKGSASSSLLFLIHRLGLAEEKVSPKIIGLSPSVQVIDFVRTHRHTIGIIGSSYLSKMGESPKETIQKMNLRLAQILNDSLQMYVHPVSKGGFNFSSYPFVRTIYCTTLDRVSGAGIRFARFMTNEQGQLIFRKSHALPAFMNFNVREVSIK